KQETNRVRVFKGMEIRMFRDYHEGDDIKSVDWKLSAKHGKLIVREYTGIEKQPGLIIVDLPLHSLPRDTPEFIRMVKHATGEVSREIETQGTASVVLISGVNIVAGLVSERNRLHCMTFIREHAHPCERLYSAYRLRMRNDLRSLNVSIGREKKQQDPGTMQQYLDHLENVVSSGIPKYKNPEFYARCSLLVRNGPSGGIRIYSMLKGDLSHIRIILSIARQIGIDVKIFSPGLSDAAVRSRLTRSLGVTGIEAIS
ncbi:MAG: DUF58 domain-containing protein, partial [Methanoregula sp.]|nr:DUF58 domain-containing protein [Methanoregula sp.]